jgi:trehalose utilization protein
VARKRRRRALWVCNPPPIARGIDRYFEIPNTEMYGEPFAIDADENVFIVVRRRRSLPLGCTWKRGNGKIFLLPSGPKFTRIYHHPTVRWCAQMQCAGPH